MPYTILLPLFAILLLSCSDSQTSEPTSPPRDLTVQEKALVSSSNDFGSALFQQVSAARPGKNVVLSPLSVSLALGMTMNGAAGETWTAMRDVLGFSPLPQSVINENYHTLMELLVSRDESVTMEIANSVWSRSGFEVSRAFVDTLRTYFDAEARSLDFSDPDAPNTINRWVDDNTHGRIRQIVPSPIPPEIMMYLINALYFKAGWSVRFDPDQTTDAAFTHSDGTEQNVRMMRREGKIDVLRSSVQGVRLPYGNGAFSMVLLLPPKGQPINDFIATLDTEKWNTLLGAFAMDADAVVELPRFELTMEESLENVLADMGMGVAFDPYRADFTGINPAGELFISSVLHKTYIRVDEEGTEAAAATSVGVGTTSVPIPIRFDRPFVFALMEGKSGAMFFLGKVESM